MKKKYQKTIIVTCLILLLLPVNSNPCTGIRLISTDGGVVYGRTMEWGCFDLGSRIALIPNRHTFIGTTPDSSVNGKIFSAKYNIIGIDALGENYLLEGMNSEGLAVGMFYQHGYAEYPKYKPDFASKTISSLDVVNYILASCKSVDEVKTAMNTVIVVEVDYNKTNNKPFIAQGHWMVTDATGKSIILEYEDSILKTYNASLGVITNNPYYNWHLTNLKNYINLSNKDIDSIKYKGSEKYIKPIGAGSGMLGLPGDNTPPSRFVRAVAWTQTARQLDSCYEAVCETFRILDNFQLPLEGAEGSSEKCNDATLRSTTQWTVAWDLKNRTLNYHTQHNRQIRYLKMDPDLFSKDPSCIKHYCLDLNKVQTRENVIY